VFLRAWAFLLDFCRNNARFLTAIILKFEKRNIIFVFNVLCIKNQTDTVVGSKMAAYFR